MPPGVWQEMTAAKNDISAQSPPQLEWIIRTEAIALNPLVSAWDLGAGESEVLSYVLTHPNTTVMIDDAAARRCAISLNIPTLGTGGMIVRAKRQGLISSVAEPIQALQASGL